MLAPTPKIDPRRLDHLRRIRDTARAVEREASVVRTEISDHAADLRRQLQIHERSPHPMEQSARDRRESEIDDLRRQLALIAVAYERAAGEVAEAKGQAKAADELYRACAQAMGAS